MNGRRIIILLLVPFWGGCTRSGSTEPVISPEQLFFGTTDIIEVNATGAEYRWEFLLPGADGELGTSDDVNLNSVLWLPPNRQIRLHFASRDYVYTFLQSDLVINEVAVPGVLTEASFLSPSEGEFDISASPMCGFMFAHEGYRPIIKIGRPEDLPVHEFIASSHSEQP